ncbi:MAG: FG-GAP-like repeat-containing protein [Ignavibacteria bacterium]|jgi:hypothetical protein
MKKILLTVFLSFLLSVISSTAQPLNNWLEFDGVDDYVSLGNSSTLKPTSALTIELWAYHADWANSNDTRFISNTNSGGYNIQIEEDTLSCFVELNDEYQEIEVSVSTITEGWHHFAVTCDGRYTKFYIDGELQGTLDAGGSYSLTYDSDNCTFLGAEAWGGCDEVRGDYFNGALDEVRIWNVARTEQQIQDNMIIEIDASSTGLVGYWKLNSTSGSTAIDEKGLNDGDLINFDTDSWNRIYVHIKSLSGSTGSTASWGDLNNDGYMDLLLYGSGTGAKVYRNNGDGTFSSIQTLTDLLSGTAAWGDYNNDGYLDAVVTGQKYAYEYETKIFKNNGNETFTEQSGISLSGTSSGSLAWGDYNNDGYLDLILVGLGSGTKLYKNNGNGNFTNSGVDFGNVVSSSDVAWSDYNNDGNLDLLLTGTDENTGSGVSKLFRNNGDGTFSNSEISITGVQNGSVAWGDYNNDGKFDFILTGYDDNLNTRISKIYKNMGGSGSNWSFQEIDGINITGVDESSVVWGDYNGDGNLDILIAGSTGSDEISKVYRNNGDGSFSETPIILRGVSYCSLAWLDYDNDNDLDIFISGSGITRIYQYNLDYDFGYIWDNTIPNPPSSLSESISQNSVVLNWNAGTDNETPSDGLTYNIRVGTSGGNDDVVNSMTDESGEFRKIPSMGNAGQSKTLTLKNLIKGRRYYWSVQSIDNAFNGSSFSTERTFIITGDPDTEAGNALEFDGVDDFVNCGNNASLDTENSITIEAWIYYEGGDYCPRIIDKYPAPSIYIRESDNLLGWYGEIDGTLVDQQFTNSVVPRNEWTHIAVTYDDSHLKSYINGELKNSKNYNGALSTTTADLLIGNSSTNTRAYKGKIDELHIWNIARSANQIRENIHRTLDGDETGLIACWQMNEDEGTLARETIACNVGTLNNMADTSWVKSTSPVGGGFSNTQTETDGNVVFTTTGVSMNFSEQSGADVTVTKINNAPNSIPELETYDSQYWVISRFGTGIFTAGITLTLNEDLSVVDEENPKRLKLYNRPETSDGSWTFVTTAEAVNAAGNNITFNGITSPGQFIVCIDCSMPDQSAGNALEFDGIDDLVDCGNDPSLNTPSKFTLEAWVYFTGGDDCYRIIDKFPAYSIYVKGSNNYIGFYNKGIVPAGGGQRTWDFTFSNGSIELNEWTHIAVNFYKSGVFNKLKLYINGEYRSIKDDYFNYLQTTTNNLYIGNREAGDRPFNGKIDEVRIWNYAKSASEIRENMHKTLQGDEAGLVGYWQMNSSAGSATVIDAGSGGNDGTLINMDVNNNWHTSTVPVGGGSSCCCNNFSCGTEAMDNVLITTTDEFDNAVFLLCTEIGNSPNTTSGITGNALDRYFVLSAFGTPGTFSTNLTFTLPDGKISEQDQATPSNLKLYRRESTADGEWNLVASGISATATTVTFEGVTSFSQFTIASETSPLPVELTSFTAHIVEENKILLEWKTATEVSNYGFEIERTTPPYQGRGAEGGGGWETLGFVAGHGNSNSLKSYSFIDNLSLDLSHNLSYRLKQIDFDGNYEYLNTVEVTIGVPLSFDLKQNYPNPFNPTTSIKYQVASIENVKLVLYNTLGQQVATLVNEQKAPGNYEVQFDASHLSSGMYLYKIDIGNKFSSVKKMLLLK